MIRPVLSKLVVLIPVLLSLSSFNPVKAEITELDSIVAVVNNDVITKLELKNSFSAVVQNLRRSGTQLPSANVLTKQVLDKLIMEKVQLDLAERSGIRSDETTLNRAIVRIAGQNGLSLREFIHTLTEQGVDFNQFRKDIRKQILLQRLQQRFVDSKVLITNQEVDNFLFNLKKQGGLENAYHIAIILTSIPEGSTPDEIHQAQQKSQNIYQELQEGANFTDLAIAKSDASNALEGGDMGWRKAGELPSLLADVVPNLKEGEISQPIQGPIGFIITKLLDIRGSEIHQVTETQARHILIKPDVTTNATQAKIKLDQLRQRILSGADFSQLARSHSDDKGSALKGGDLGWFKPGVMVPEFDKAVSELQPGDLSDIVETAFGFHIIEVLGRRQKDDSKEFIRNKARKELRQRKITENKAVWLRRIRDEAHIDIRINE